MPIGVDVLPLAAMKLTGVLGVVLGGSMIVGCAGGAPRAANAPANVFDVANAELSHAIGSTTLSSAPVATSGSPARDGNPLYLSDESEAPARTWGGAPTEQQIAESDLAANPYTSSVATPATVKDIYDPR